MREMTTKGRGVPPAAPATALTMLCLAMLALPGMARPGDRSRRDDDRYLMLEALLAARDKLYVS